MLKWCQEATQEKGLPKSDYWGGFVIDEMKIQVRVIFNYITNKNWLNIRPMGKLLLILRNLCSKTVNMHCILYTEQFIVTVQMIWLLKR